MNVIRNFEQDLFALATLAVGGAVFIGVLRNPEGLGRGLGAFFAGTNQLVGTLVRGR